MVGRISAAIDRWRRGPELRELARTLERERNAAADREKALRAQGDRRERALQLEIHHRDERLALLAAFAQTLRANCHKCGKRTNQWRPVLTTSGDIASVCYPCAKAMARQGELRHEREQSLHATIAEVVHERVEAARAARAAAPPSPAEATGGEVSS